jgi:16S rRNA (cytidine1402-2'-O)-methyltransferase
VSGSKTPESAEGPRLILAAGPIGNMGDLTPRAREALEAAAFVIAEDTRVTGKLLHMLGISKPMALLNDHMRPEKVQALAERARDEGPAVLLTDAGTPGISDPGAELVDLCRTMGISVDALPGASAPTLALSLSGFFAQRYAFLGFLPRKPGPAAQALLPFKDSTLSLVLFESPHRWDKTLATAFEVLGDRRTAVCRELTKLHQQVWRGRLGSLPGEKIIPRKGEFTLVIEGMRRKDLDLEDGIGEETSEQEVH